MNKRKEVSEATAHIIDQEVRAIIDRNYELASKILRERIDKLHLMADALIKYETIGEQQISDIMTGHPARPPENWEDTDLNSPSNKPAAEDNNSALFSDPNTATS